MNGLGCSTSYSSNILSAFLIKVKTGISCAAGDDCVMGTSFRTRKVNHPGTL